MADLRALREQMKKRKKIESSFSSSKKDVQNQNKTEEAEFHYHLGKCYERGLEGYPKDETKEYQEYQVAAELGHPKAIFEIAAAYAVGHTFLGTDLNNAEVNAKKAIEYGNPDGYWVLAHISNLKDKNIEAGDLLEIGIQQGSLSCIEWKAWLLYWGNNEYGEEIESRPQEAFDMLKDIDWDNDHGLALEVLGHISYDKDDYAKAIAYYERSLALDGENNRVKGNLGRILRGQDAYLDYNRARLLLKDAAEDGFLDAMNQYALMLLQGEGGPEDISSGIEWFKKAANEGHGYAMFNLGDIFADDNPAEAEVWFQRALDAGIREAREKLQELKEKHQTVNQSHTYTSVVVPPKINRTTRRGEYYITDRCISCGTCEPVCPVEAISPGEIYWIDPDTCIACGSCAAVCPNDAIDD